MIRTKSLETGEYLEMEEVIADDKDECFQFTWVGIAEEGNNTDFQSCTDYEEDVRKTYFFLESPNIFQFPTLFERDVPCFAPLVWTYDDDNGLNSPDLEEIVSECERTGCNPFCARSGGMCMKYTVTDRHRCIFLIFF